MSFAGILFALFYAVILTAIFSLVFKNTGPWGGFWIFFFLLFFVSLGAGEWAAPAGPVVWGYYWVPVLIAAVIFALLLAAVTPTPVGPRRFNNGAMRKKMVTDKINEEIDTAATVAVLGIFFWILLIILVVAAIAGVFFRQNNLLAQT